MSSGGSTVEDYDRRRATELVLNDATRRLLTVSEVNEIRNAVAPAEKTSVEKRMVALAMLDKANNGKVLSYDESRAVAQAVEEIWLHKPVGDGFDAGVRDLSATCHRCACKGGSKCAECLACPFSEMGVVGGGSRNSLAGAPLFSRPLTKPEDCGCKGDMSK